MDHPYVPPPLPWAKGTNAEYSSISLVVDVCRDTLGRTYSAHRLQTPLDHETVMTWPSGGQEQVATALLVEAARREAMLDILLVLSRDPALLESLKSSGDPPPDVVRELVDGLRAQINRTIEKIAISVVKEALQSLKS